METRGGARRGAGRKPKPLIELVQAGTFSVTRHRRLLWTDDSLLEAAVARPDDAGLQQLARINEVVRDRRSPDAVRWFARTLRLLKEEAKTSHKIEMREDYDADGVLRIEAVAEGRSEPAITIRIVRDQLCPHCVATTLRGVADRYQAATG